MLTAQEIIKKTLDLAKKSDDSDVPVAAIVICDNQIIASATNTREQDQDLFGHAEINVIKIAQKKLKTWLNSWYKIMLFGTNKMFWQCVPCNTLLNWKISLKKNPW